MSSLELKDLPSITRRVSARAKHLQIKISANKGIELVVPQRLPPWVDIDAFLESKRGWIESHAHLAKQAELIPELPRDIPLRFLNENWQVDYDIAHSRLQLITRPNHSLVILGKQHEFAPSQRLLKQWILTQAKTHLLPRLAWHSQRTGLNYQAATIRSASTRWGSCSAKKSINLNPQLLFLPKQLVDYVMIHELAHTVHLNHQRRFWQLVEKHDAAYREHDKALKNMNQAVPKWLAA